MESIPLAGAEARWPADFVVVTVPSSCAHDRKRGGPEMGRLWGRPKLGALCGGLMFLVWQGGDGLSAGIHVYVFILYELAVWSFERGFL